tara:strand:+ start:2820 stop:3062 length:243 start_codon:yes stop_codon:yes gene_type:complete
MTNRSSDDELYEYYNLRGVPARLVFNKQGDLVGSDTFDVETEELRLSGDLAQILKDPHSDPITEDEFHNLCKELVRRKHQ